MACRLFRARPLSGAMMDHCYFDNWEQIAMQLKSKLEKITQENELSIASLLPFCLSFKVAMANSLASNTSMLLEDTIRLRTFTIRTSDSQQHVSEL